MSLCRGEILKKQLSQSKDCSELLGNDRPPEIPSPRTVAGPLCKHERRSRFAYHRCVQAKSIENPTRLCPLGKLLTQRRFSVRLPGDDITEPLSRRSIAMRLHNRPACEPTGFPECSSSHPFGRQNAGIQRRWEFFLAFRLVDDPIFVVRFNGYEAVQLQS